MERNKLNDYLKTFAELQRHLKWKVFDKRILMTIASIYVMKQKEFHIPRFLDIADEIKRKSSPTSAIRSYPRFTAAAVLDVNFVDAKKQIPRLFDLYQKFRDEKFNHSTYTYIAALIVLTNKNKQQPAETIVRHTKDIYDAMKKEHFFLTGPNDYPLATLLAMEEHSDIISQMELYYEELNKNGFYKGNDLQFLSHILSFNRETEANDTVSRCLEIMDTFRHYGIKPKDTFYPLIGMLVLLPKKDFHMDAIISIYEALNQQIKWQKEMNFIIAVSLYLSAKLKNDAIAEAGIYTILETLLQAHQAVMFSTIVAVYT